MTTPPSSWTTDLQNRYELLEEAGRGGMGVVYKARDRETGEIVALKILKPDIAADPAAGERFLNEVRLSRRITHKNVCRVYEFTRTGNTGYLSMEFVEGESLRAIVERMGALALRKGMQIARQICAALHEAHHQGIIHRDLKPENVMLDKAGHVKVMDFGIARLVDTSVTATASGIVGTPAYMAPEQAEGKDLDARTDIYAVGLILYEIFTGRPAFTGDSPMVIALKQIRETPAPPRTVEPAIPWELDAAIMRCLEKDPAARFQSIEELDAALAAVSLGGTTGLQQPVLPPEGGSYTPTRPVASAFRRKTLVLTAVALLAVAGAVAAWLLLRDSEAIPFTRFTLNNGLRIILAEDHSAPTVAVSVSYNVGTKDSPEGREGLAHLFEHMMFNGSLNVGKGEHQYLVTKEGGAANGNTYADQTHFWQTLPSNQLELALFLEADRMRSLRLDPARLETERNTILTERRQRIDNTPYGTASELLYRVAYDTPGYKRSMIGTEDGLRAITLQEINDFFRVFFAPNNAVLTIVGDFDPDDARAKVEKYFQHIPAQPPAPSIDLTEPEQKAERRQEIQDPFAPAPRVLVGYKTPPGSTRETEALHLASALLTDGAASRLHQKLVKEREVVAFLGSSVDVRQGPGIFVAALQPAPGKDPAAMLQAYDEVLKEVREQGVTEADVERARTRLKLNRAAALQQTYLRAILLAEFEMKFGGADGVNERDAWLASITPDDVKRVVTEYLTPERRTVIVALPGGSRPTFAASAVAPQDAVPQERLHRAPVARDVARVTLPRATETTLDNGLTLLTAESRRAPLVVARFEIRGAGTLGATGVNPAVPIAAGAMLREGTPTRSSRQIAEELDALGASLAVGQTADTSAMTVIATGIDETFDAWLPIVADVVMHASFPSDELTVLKPRLLAEWQGRRAAPAGLAAEVFTQAVHGPQAARPLDQESIARMTSDDLRAWHRERYVPQNVVVTIGGAITSADAERQVRQAFGGWARTATAEPAVSVQVPDQARVFVVDRPGSTMVTLMVGAPTVDRAHADHLPLVLANRILAGGPASRLAVQLREQRGLTYGVAGNVSAFKHGGDWRIAGDFPAQRLGEALPLLLAELQRLRAEPPPDGDLVDAKRAIVANVALTLEQLVQIVNYVSTRRVYGLSTDYWDRYPEKVMAVGAADVQRAAQYLDPAKLQIVAVGDANQLEPLLAALGPVTIVR